MPLLDGPPPPPPPWPCAALSASCHCRVWNRCRPFETRMSGSRARFAALDGPRVGTTVVSEQEAAKDAATTTAATANEGLVMLILPAGALGTGGRLAHLRRPGSSRDNYVG